MALETKKVKDLGWEHISLTQKGFQGAVQTYLTDKGEKVAVAFNMHEAFVVADDQGLFGVQDLVEGIIKDRDIDIEDTGDIIGAEAVAWEENSEITYNDEKLTSLGLNAFEVKESLKTRLFHLAQLDKMVDMPL